MPDFKASDVRKAFKAIKADGHPKGFGSSTKWDIVDEATNEVFPPKAVLFLAKQIAGDESRSGGGGDRGTNNALRARGFDVILKTTLENSDEAVDVQAILDAEIDATTKQRLVNARLGQGGFREALIEISAGKCALTKLDIEAVLRASHIKPWRDSDNKERLDPANGLLLAASVDALFDRHLITFEDDGSLLVSSTISEISLARIGVRQGLCATLTAGNRTYLRDHRRVFALRGSSYRY